MDMKVRLTFACMNLKTGKDSVQQEGKAWLFAEFMPSLTIKAWKTESGAGREAQHQLCLQSGIDEVYFYWEDKQN